jgi:hypothetical protein
VIPGSSCLGQLDRYDDRMETPLNASATPAGALLSTSTFVVPPFQREYAWSVDEVEEFWSDLRLGLEDDSYFLGLVILTDEDGRKHVVDGQQRILTVTMLASAFYHEAIGAGRNALAERINADFLSAIDYETDEMQARVVLSDERDNATFQAILREPDEVEIRENLEDDSISPRLFEAYKFLRKQLRSDLSSDPFKRLGLWTDYLTNHVYFAVFIHPDPASAYRVFEVINTRGRELTTADLLKNYILNQTAPRLRQSRYQEWKGIARALEPSGSGALVQYIRHVSSLRAGYVLPRDLFDYLTGRPRANGKDRRVHPSVGELMSDLESWVPLYLQIVDPSVAGPAEQSWLGVFSSLNELNVISVRPVVMALSVSEDATEGMNELLKLVVRRIVVGNLGTGNVERRFSEAARKILENGQWRVALRELNDLNPSAEDFVEQLRKRSLNKGTLTFLRRSILQGRISPEPLGYMHLIRPRQAPEWYDFPDDEFTYWGSTLGNTILAKLERRPRLTGTWEEFGANLLPLALLEERVQLVASRSEWSSQSVEYVGTQLAKEAALVWYPES